HRFSAFGIDQKGSQIPVEARTQIRQAASAVGMILVRNSTDPADKEPRPKGSAVVVRKDGIIVSNNHVVYDEKSRAYYDQIFFDLLVPNGQSSQTAKRMRLKPILINQDRDLCLLRVVDGEGKPATSLNLPTMELGDSRAVQPLDDLAVIGFPEQGGSTVTVN